MSAKRASSSNKSLASENAKLRAENEMLKKQLKAKKPGSGQSYFSRTWRGLSIGLCIALAGALLAVGNIFFWAGNTLVNNDKYIATVSPLIQQPAIQQGVSAYVTEQIFSNYDVQGLVGQVLPPRADFLAPQLTSQLKTGTQATMQKLLASPKFQQIWINTQQRAHQRTINFITNYQGDGDINLNDIYKQLSRDLQGTKLSFLADKQLPDNVGDIHIATAGWLPVAHKLVTNIGTYQAITSLLVILFSALAVWLSRGRRRTLIRLGVLMAILMLLTLISLRVLKSVVVSHAQPQYQEAISSAASVILQPLIIQTRVLLMLSGLLALIAWISGPSRSAKAVSSRVDDVFAGKLHQSIFSRGENSFTLWTGRHRRALQWLAVALVAVVMLFVALTPQLVVIYCLVALLLVLLVEVLAASSSAKVKRS